MREKELQALPSHLLRHSTALTVRFLQQESVFQDTRKHAESVHGIHSVQVPLNAGHDGHPKAGQRAYAPK